MKELFVLSSIYVAIEFIDYLTGVLYHIYKGDYTSHTAKIGALKKLGVTLIVISLPIVSKILSYICLESGYTTPDSITMFSGFFIVKQIATEISSCYENMKGFLEDEKKR